MTALTLRTLQEEVLPWQEHNFPNRQSYQRLLGTMEELGELAHAHIKEEEGIRGTSAEHQAAAKDAVGDIIVSLAGYCNDRGFDMQTILEDTWAKVRQRDWAKHREEQGGK